MIFDGYPSHAWNEKCWANQTITTSVEILIDDSMPAISKGTCLVNPFNKNPLISMLADKMSSRNLSCKQAGKDALPLAKASNDSWWRCKPSGHLDLSYHSWEHISHETLEKQKTDGNLLSTSGCNLQKWLQTISSKILMRRIFLNYQYMYTIL